jgi:hypothetical protein
LGRFSRLFFLISTADRVFDRCQQLVYSTLSAVRRTLTAGEAIS